MIEDSENQEKLGQLCSMTGNLLCFINNVSEAIRVNASSGFQQTDAAKNIVLLARLLTDLSELGATLYQRHYRSAITSLIRVKESWFESEKSIERCINHTHHYHPTWNVQDGISVLEEMRPVLMWLMLRELSNSAYGLCGLSHEMYVKHYSAAVDEAIAALPQDIGEEILGHATAFDYANDDEIAMNESELRNRGLCSHGIELGCCPAGCE
ncbi:hypothetical protein VNTUMSATTG_61100 (plasmid) [Vibrio nigripulchritudo]|uniref:hypothetical protein n=1 Tax=Vibrio nigripulchritudo TaxID=28173 RepID=UPI00190B9868|nr:hypothetical protein [Vibrio nigripulchritudo]BCL74173.1 hypothetical protein VNTUMSATTG_61100 [Vibrio nigripulchritudo]